MKIQRREGSDERKLLIGLIVNKTFLAHVSIKGSDFFLSRWSNLIAGWCVDYYEKYKRAPGPNIEPIFDVWASKTKDKESIELISRFLGGLDNDYKRLKEEEVNNTDYLLDLAGKHFNKTKITRLITDAQSQIDAGDYEKVLEEIKGFNKIELGTGHGIDVLHDVHALSKAFGEDTKEPLFRYPGALGKFLGRGGLLSRDSFVAFMGPEKRGKTWFLIDVAWRSILARKKVAFFEVGDMSADQVMNRFGVRAAKIPSELDPDNPIRYPTKMRVRKGIAEVLHKEMDFSRPITYGDAKKAFANLIKNKLKTKSPLLRLSVHPNFSISINGIDSILSDWEREGWVPDVIVIDYADILADPLPGKAEPREQINTSWKLMRGMSQKWHSLVVTATQSDSASYKAPLLRMENFNGDKRKYGHVLGMIGLNQTPEEKERGLMRLNLICGRELFFSPSKVCHVAGCLGLGQPTVMSHF